MLRPLIVLASLLLPSVLYCQAPAPPFGEVRGAFLAVSVGDLAASTRWYAEKLGLRVMMQVTSQNGVAVAVLEGGGLTVELVQLDAAAPRAGGAELTHGLFKAGIVVDDLAGSLERLRALGVEIAFGPFPARQGQRANAIIRDNAGNLIQLFGR